MYTPLTETVLLFLDTACFNLPVLLIPPSFRGGLRIHSKLRMFLYQDCHGTQFLTIQNPSTASRKFRFFRRAAPFLVDHRRVGELYLGREARPDHDSKGCCRPPTSTLPILGQFEAARSQFCQLSIVLSDFSIGRDQYLVQSRVYGSRNSVYST